MALQPVDFENLKIPNSPNYYFACPENFCNAVSNQIVPTFSMPVSALIQSWQAMIKQQPRTKLLQADISKHRYFYVQRSLIFRFPDYITVQFIAIDDYHSTVAIFSQSKYGYSDLGVNKKRVKAWLTQLEQRANQ